MHLGFLLGLDPGIVIFCSFQAMMEQQKKKQQQEIERRLQVGVWKKQLQESGSLKI